MKPLDQLSEDEFAQLVQRAVALPDAPPALVRAAIAQWHAVQPLVPGAAQAVLKRVVAVLTFDSWSQGSLAFGVRAASSEIRHLLFSAEGRDIDVRITPMANGSSFAMTGQFSVPTSPEWSNWRACSTVPRPRRNKQSRSMPWGNFASKAFAAVAFIR